MLEIKNITKKFGEFEVLSDVSFKIDENCVVGLLGPNGAGKTTLMRVLVGFLAANSGKILWNKKLVNTKSMTHKSRVGYLPENNPLYGYLKVVEYLEFVAVIKGCEKDGMKLSVLQAAKECGLMEVFGQKIETLSKGYRQRVGLAAAMIGDPEILILDEPTSGLDPNQIIEIRDLIKKLSKKKMVLLSTHILPEAKAVCDKLLVINRGRIVLDEKTNKIRSLEKRFVELTV
jgi:ABC-2 type transport system ATP-binding protein